MRGLLMSALLIMGLAQTALAKTVEEQVLAELRAQGYVILEDGFTFLGRLRIVAENGEIHRELVVNPGTGEVLRDYAIRLSDMAPRTVSGGASVHGSTGSASSTRVSTNSGSTTSAAASGSTSAVADGATTGPSDPTSGVAAVAGEDPQAKPVLSPTIGNLPLVAGQAGTTLSGTTLSGGGLILNDPIVTTPGTP